MKMNKKKYLSVHKSIVIATAISLTPCNRLLLEKLIVINYWKSITKAHHLYTYHNQINIVYALPSNSLNTNFKLVLPSTSRFSKWFFALCFSNKTLYDSPYVPDDPPVFFLFDHLNDLYRGTKIF
jgi:hypothetical protein